MAKYRAVLLVPSVVEFENPGTMEHVTEQVNRIASGLGRAKSLHPRQSNSQHEIYSPRVLECVVVDGAPETPKTPLGVVVNMNKKAPL